MELTVAESETTGSKGRMNQLPENDIFIVPVAESYETTVNELLASYDVATITANRASLSYAVYKATIANS